MDGNDEAHKLKDPSFDSNSIWSQGLNLNPVGAGNDYLSYPMLADMGFKTGKSRLLIFQILQSKTIAFHLMLFSKIQMLLIFREMA
jgi:alpha-L-rhamnosidase